MAETFIKAAGLYSIVFAVLHLLFWWLLDWKEELRKLSAVNEAIMRVLNLGVAFTFVIFGYISLAHAHELLVTPLGRVLLMLIALYWLARAIEQVLFFEHRDWGSWVFFALFLVGTGLYAYPALLAI
ncbi:MAG TPA: hypothetical protein VFM35_03675 [Candidatus Binatia bacterium]|nr:hypothetical protein [Candidatus Binatia bacterium]